MNSSEDTISRNDIIVLLVLVLGSMTACCFFVLDGFGETDAARMAVRATVWHHTGELRSDAVYSCPLYLCFLKWLLHGGVSVLGLAGVMNWFSAVCHSAALAVMFLLWRSWGNIHVATLGCLFWFFMPAAWWAGIYGMGHMPGFLCLLISLYFFQRVTMSSGAGFWCWAILSLFMATMAVCWKTDTILCYPVFFGVALISSKNRICNLLSILIPIASLVTVLVFCHLLVATDAEFGSYTSDWNKSFPFTLAAWGNWGNILILIRTCGKYMLGGAILAWFYCAAHVKYRKWALFALVWLAPATLFWGSKMANSSRHMLAAFSVLAFILAIAMVKVCKKPTIAYVLAILLIAINYFGTVATADTVRPSGRLFESAILQQQHLDWLYNKSNEFVALPYERKYLIGGITNPYMVAGFLDGKRQIEVMYVRPREYVVIDEKGKTQYLRSRYTLERPVTLGPVQGWYCWACEENITVKNQGERQ